MIAACEAVATHVAEQRRRCSRKPNCPCGDQLLAWAQKLEPVDTLSLW